MGIKIDTKNLQAEEPFESFNEIANSAKLHLKKRESLLAKRVFKMSWPLLLSVGFLFIALKFQDIPYLVDISGILFVISLPAALAYYLIILIILSVEKVIWVDSYYDKKNLNQEDSWNIAKKLFWKTSLFKFYLFVRFYSLPLFIYLFGVFYALYLPIGLDIKYSPWYFILYFIVAGPIILYVYFYYLKIKLRYAWMLFLDHVGSAGFSYRDLFKQLEELNKAGLEKTGRKSLFIYVVSDLAFNFFQLIVGSFSQTLGRRFGRGGEVAGFFIGGYANELGAHTASLMRISTNYIFYRHARKDLYDEEQRINEYIYSLK